MRLVAILALLGVALAGCISDEPVENGADTVDPTTAAVLTSLDTLAFSKMRIIDDLRAGGEPVIAITKAGTILVSSHPGWTHYHPSEDPTHPGLELVQPANGQSYLWRSTDGGETFTHVGLAGTEHGPRGTGLGVSDPEFTVMADGTICFTDLEALASSSVSCSTDDGVTWVGNPVASQRPNDRQWLASYEDELYFTANYFTDHSLIASTDRGITWELRGDVPCSGDIIADPVDGTIYAGCGNGVAVSEDGGFTWEEREVDLPGRGRAMAEPAIDSAGNVWMTWAHEEERLFVAGTPDKGLTWPWSYELTDDFIGFANETTGVAGNGTFVWPWISAGSEGRVAVTWIGSYERGPSSKLETDWFMFSAIIVDAHKGAAGGDLVRIYQSSDAPIHHGPICQSGTACQVASMQGDDAGDRRLGDFFETTIDRQGRLHIVVSNTLAAKEDVVSHVAYMRQETGLPLYLEGDREPTQG